MLKNLKLTLVWCVASGFFTLIHAGSTNETLYFIGDDLKTGLRYENIRYDTNGPKSLYFGQNYNKNKMSYIKPDGYSWKKENLNGELVDKLEFSYTNNYAFLERIRIKEDLGLIDTKQEDELYVELDSGSCLGDGCIRDENIISVVVPKKFQITHYEAKEKNNGVYAYNPDANFKLVDNTLTFYSNNIQGAYIRLWFKDVSKTSAIYQNVSTSLEQFREITVSKTETETKIVMPMDNAFDSGKATVKPLGKKWLLALSSALKNQNFKEMRVEGHTDSTPIKGIYPSNWELSSARASDAVRFLISQGIDNTKIAVVGYADTRPVADNNTKESRAKNRRIEITIVGNADSEAVTTPTEAIVQ